MVMLGPPNGGSAVADLLHKGFLYRSTFGPAGQQLTTRNAEAMRVRNGTVDCPLGIIAGDRSLLPIVSDAILREPNDGKVAVSSTKLDGMADHLVVGVAHAWLMRDPEIISQMIAFLRTGRFLPATQHPRRPR